MAIDRKDDVTGNYCKDIIHRVHNQLRLLTLDKKDRDPMLSDCMVGNIELMPPSLPIPGYGQTRQLNPPRVTTIYISVDSARKIDETELTDHPRQMGDFVEEYNIRLDVYVGRCAENESVTSRSADLICDIGYVLSPTTFVGAPLSTGFSEDTIDLRSLIYSDRVEDLKDEIKNQKFDEFIRDLERVIDSSKKAKITLSQNAKLINACLLQWSFNELTRGSGEEWLVFIFQAELHHNVQKFVTYSNT